MWLIIKTAWRNLFRQRRRTLITVSAMAVSLIFAIPLYGLTEGLNAEMLKGITGMSLGHLQIHNPSYPKGRALSSTLKKPDELLKGIRAHPSVKAAAARVIGYALASHDNALKAMLVGLSRKELLRLAGNMRVGRGIDPRMPWQRDTALSCEALIHWKSAKKLGITVGMVLSPKAARPGGACERIRVVGYARKALNGVDARGKLILGLALGDMKKAFAKVRLETDCLLRHSAPIDIMGIEPEEERRITFMADKIIKGKYLGPKATGEIVVGHRLAHTLHLEPGAKLFVQAGALDQTKGTYYQDFKVRGIYKTGVAMVDRSRVFMHIGDARRLMALKGRAHEIVIRARKMVKLNALKTVLAGRVLKLGLMVGTRPAGKRAGSTALPAPIYVESPGSGKSALLTPYDLKNSFEDLPGLAATARRIYGKTLVASAVKVKGRIIHQKAAALKSMLSRGKLSADRCLVYISARLARRWGLKRDGPLIPAASAAEEGEGCPMLKVGGIYPDRAERNPLGSGPSWQALPWLFALAPNRDGGDGDLEVGIPDGSVALFKLHKPRSLRMVGVEPGRERRLSQLHRKIMQGRYFETGAGKGEGGTIWPVLLPAGMAGRMKVKPGATLLIKSRNTDKIITWRRARVIGLLDDRHWPESLPPMVLPYYPAQQIDAPRLNARAHEILLIPTAKTAPASLVLAASKQLKPIIRTWQEIEPTMAKLLKMQDTWIGILLIIIFAIAAMTVMNTMLMAVFERTREFGVLKSIGMRPVQVFGMIITETFFIAVIAAVLGGGVGILLDYWLAVTGLDLSSITSGMTYEGTFISPIWKAMMTVKSIALPIVMVMIVCFLVSFYPAFRAGRLRPVEALRQQ